MTHTHSRDALAPEVPELDREFLGFSEEACFVAGWHKRGRRGYASMYVKEQQRIVGAHRVAFMLFIGMPNRVDMVLHRCGNAECVNPHHLYAGGDAENLRDRLLHQEFRGGSPAPVVTAHVPKAIVFRPMPPAMSREMCRLPRAFSGFKMESCFEAEWLVDTLDGYRQLPGRQMAGAVVGAHRKAFELFNGPLSMLEIVTPSCGNQACLNPFHQQVSGTHPSRRDFDFEHDRRCKISSAGLAAVLDFDKSAAAVATTLGVHRQTVATLRADMRRKSPALWESA